MKQFNPNVPRGQYVPPQPDQLITLRHRTLYEEPEKPHNIFEGFYRFIHLVNCIIHTEGEDDMTEPDTWWGVFQEMPGVDGARVYSYIVGQTRNKSLEDAEHWALIHHQLTRASANKK